MTTTEIPSIPSCAGPPAASTAKRGPQRAPSTFADDIDAVSERAVATNAEIVEPPHQTAFGSAVPTRAFTARDREGNLWTFGTYRGAH
jgi:uncharacterized glyoxalase superfamily protein PhnB